jgi:hypothetical protein
MLARQLQRGSQALRATQQPLQAAATRSSSSLLPRRGRQHSVDVSATATPAAKTATPVKITIQGRRLPVSACARSLVCASGGRLLLL